MAKTKSWGLSKALSYGLMEYCAPGGQARHKPFPELMLISDLRTGDLLVLDAATHKEWKRMNVGHGVAGILVTPDCSRAYVAATSDNNVAIVNLKNLTV